MIFLKEFSKKLILKKIFRRPPKKHEKFLRGQRVKIVLTTSTLKYKMALSRTHNTCFDWQLRKIMKTPSNSICGRLSLKQILIQWPFHAIHKCCLLSHLLMYFGSLYGKHYGPRSDCSLRTSLIRVHSFCFHCWYILTHIWIYTVNVISRWYIWIKIYWQDMSFILKSIWDTLNPNYYKDILGTQWLSGRVLDWRTRDRGIEPHGVTALWSLSKTHLS